MRRNQISPFVRNGRVHLNRHVAGRGVSSVHYWQLEVCGSAVVMLYTPCSEVVWRVLATQSIRQFPPSIPLPCVTVCNHISTGLYVLGHSHCTSLASDLSPQSSSFQTTHTCQTGNNTCSHLYNITSVTTPSALYVAVTSRRNDQCTFQDKDLIHNSAILHYSGHVERSWTFIWWRVVWKWEDKNSNKTGKVNRKRLQHKSV